MPRAHLALAILLAPALFAGCLGSDTNDARTARGGPVDYATIEAAIGAPIVPDHDHGDPALHEDRHNLELVALVGGEPGRDKPPTELYAETAVKDGYAYLTRYGPEAGLVIFDVHDIEDPQYLSFIKLEAGFEPDIEVSDDGNWAFWETQRFPISAETPSLTEPGANAHRGVHIVDVSDKANPRWAGFSPTWPDGPHSITYAEIDGRHILFQSVYAFAYAYGGVVVPGAQRLIVSELDTSGPVATLEVLAEYALPEAEGNTGQMPHDLSVYQHPITGQTLAYVAYWDQGAVILDVGVPEEPTLVGHYTDFGPAPYGAIHMVRQFPDTIAGRVVAVAEPEIGSQPDSGYLTFFDVTDPADPTYLSSWRLPGELTSEGGLLGPHYFDVADGRVAMASYHAGYWVIDVHDEENLLHPRPVAYSQPLAAGSAATPLFGGNPSAFDAWWYEGHLVVGDIHGGLGVLRYTGPAQAQVS